MKILQVAKYPPQSSGGIEKLTRQLTYDLNKKGNRVDILCFEENSRTKIDVFLTHTVYRCRSLFKLFSTSISIHNIYFFSKLQKSYDCIYIHLPNPLVAAYILFAIDKDKKIIVHHHADVSRKKLYFFYKFIEQKIFKRATKIITTSSSLAKSPSLVNHQDKVEVIPLYLDTQDYKNIFNKNLENSVLEVSENYKYILFVGRLVRYKRLDILLKAFQKLNKNNIKLVIIGKGKEKQKLIKDSIRLGIDKKIIILENIDDVAKRCFLKNALFAVLPSLSSEEAFGFFQLESMAQSTPVISFKIKNSGVGDVNKNNSSGIVLPVSHTEEENIDNLCKAFIKLQSNSKLRERLSFGAYERSKLFSKKENLKKYFKIIDNI